MMQANNMDDNRLLINYPKTHAFIAYAATAIKGKNSEIWLEALKDYRIGEKCSCGECYTFGLIPPAGEHSFAGDGMIGFFGETTIVLHSNKEGSLIKVELPEITNIPFLDEYLAWGTSNTDRALENRDEPYAAMKQWFESFNLS